ncbi:Flp pilus assembly protein CpaB [Vibrio sp. J1-1]|uniref:Flp pilus assembly protein CpaB n=1 Tax=Vibrio sp. J1-1 TaxID=2912251 RepID=UPI001F418E66|nr:Flp pilus assembly protein CpaB [Vibrio sp. J1-1]MCF7482207.1 Flp pilus assembly protein CpaB [Vibrio sp. J1-1]
MKKLIFVLLGGATLVAMLVVAWLSTASPQTDKPAEMAVKEKAVVPKILVAKYAIQAGALLKAEDFRWAPMPSDSNTQLNDVFLEGFIKPDVLKGSLLTRSLAANQSLAVSDIIRPEQSQYMSAMLSPGMRAVTLEMSLAGMNYDLLRPGNYVDVILTSKNEHASEKGFGEVTKRATSVILENTRLLAINNILTDIVSGPKHQNDSDVSMGSGETLPVTFEVTPEGAQRLLLAKTLGDLSLILRGYQQDERSLTTSTMATLWDEELSDNHHPDRKPQHTIRIFSGEDIRTQEKSTTR